MTTYTPISDDKIKALLTDPSLLEQLDPQRLPRHVAIIMDGNGRWAAAKGLPRALGHRSGAEALRNIIKISSALGIEVLTVYAFSTENWRRSADEVDFLMNLMIEYMKSEIGELHRNNVRVNPIGDLDRLPPATARELTAAKELTRQNSGLIVNVAVNYGSRQEIIRAAKLFAAKVQAGEAAIDDLTENAFADLLYTAGQPDPDLVIRPSGELRLSNYLMYQAAYAELYFTEVYWPDFNADQYVLALLDYAGRERRFGTRKQDKR